MIKLLRNMFEINANFLFIIIESLSKSFGQKVIK